ncbi:SAM-dependent methyltransferase [Rhodococcoides trifolii]|uniref:SAM-dependent methyltransferase n=1 Tax=Rhodococcoides trifolii TaxID=908250 RepID=A0A917CSQ7_9NOCA|nr:mycofactocin oligosaccharide methyltransferase MftM [Rhodococcus trifolii]GGF97029.1 SAM-dependent methyltransferase [Rhodococcus trifolii]
MTASVEEFDSLAPCLVPGRWTHLGVTVEHSDDEAELRVLRSESGLSVWHNLTPDDLSEALVGDVTEQVAQSGLGQSEFESVMVGLVLSTMDDPVQAWTTYYRNSLDELLDGTADFAPIHAKAEELIRGSVVDLGSCFGFFPLRLATHGRDVTATDIHSGTIRLLDAVLPHLGLTMNTLVCDGGDVPVPDGSSDTVTALHLLEHVDAELGDRIVQEALRVARDRVVIAVPFEDQAQACHGHVRTFDLESLAAVGARSGHPFEVFEHHGGWLVIEV